MTENEICVPEDFDWLTYLELNPDLLKTSNEIECKHHYKFHGFYEKRPYKKTHHFVDLNDFDWKIYKQLNLDLPQDLVEEAYKNHFIMHGIKEGRQHKIEEKKLLFENNYIFFSINKIGLLFRLLLSLGQ
jgi:hypothetical protein